MKEGLVTVIICVMLCFMGIAFMFFVLGIHDATVENYVETVDNCEHDWVTASEYSVLGRGYRTVSKCSKCGKVVK